MSINTKMKVKIHNRFDIFKTDVITGETKQVAQAENIILNQHWTYFNTKWGNMIWLGTGTGVLDPARTTLFNSIGSVSASFENEDFSLLSEGIISQRRYVVLSEVEQVGVIFTEIGIGTATRPHTHALLQDMNGNPVSIEKTNTEILTIYGTIYAYVDLDMLKNKKVIFPWIGYQDNGVSRFVTPMVKTLLGSDYSFFISKYYFVNDSILVGIGPTTWVTTPVIHSTNTGASWNAGTKTLTYPTRRYAVGSANAKPIRSFGITNSTYTDSTEATIAIGLIDNPDWAGSFIEGESIGVGDGATKDFVTDYGFIRSGAKVYVDGIEQVSGVTVDEGLPIINRVDYFCWVLDCNNWRCVPGSQARIMVKTGGFYCIFENLLYQKIGIDDVALRNCQLYCSNDLENWTLAADGKSANTYTDFDVSAYRSYRYWKMVKPSDSSSDDTRFYNFRSDDLVGVTNVHFDAAPADEAVITIDYTTDECVKTSNYVLDVSFSIEFDEYTEEY